MKRFNLWLLLSLFVSAFMFTACSSSDDATSGSGGQGGGGNIPVPMTMAKLSGFVYTPNGVPLAGVTVTSGTTTVTTNEHGAFTLSSVNVQNGRSIVKFSHPFYSEIVRSVEAKDGDVWEVTLLDPGLSASFNASAGKTLATTEGMTVDIPANSVKTANGDAYTGTVYMEMSYLSPNDDNFSSSMPGGDLAAAGYEEKDASNPNPQLISYGMTNVSLRDGQNNPLLLDGKAKLTFPAPEGLEAHDKIPLWSFNEETGLWDYEGEATRQADGSYEGEVEHFSWHNLDYPEKRATCKVVVKDANGRAIGFQKVIVGQVQATTDENGEFSCNVPTNTQFDVAVRSVDYSNYAPEVSQKVTITTAGETRIVTLTLPATSTLKGTITNKGAGTQVSLTLTYGNKSIKPVMSGTNGRYIMNLPIGYTGPATLDILAADGTVFKKNILLTGVDQTVDYAIDAQEIAKGTVTFTSEKLTKSFEISDFPAYSLGGVVLLGNTLEVISGFGKHHGAGPSGEVNASIYINEKYDPSVTGYTGNFSIWQESQDSYSNLYPIGNNMGIGVVRNGNLFNFSLNGSARYYESDSGYSEVDGSVSGSFAYSLLAEIVETGSTTNPASWVPLLAGKTPKHAATILENPKLGNGWYYEYNSDETLDEYNSLVNSAKAQIGEPYFVNDDAEDTYNKQYVFISGNQYLAISFNGYASSSHESDLHPYDILGSGGNARIKIQAFSNVTIPFTELVSGAYFR